MLTAFGQTAFGQFWCFNVLAKFSVVVVWLLLFLVVACCCLLLLVVVCWCLLVPVGACWCLVPVGCWCLLVPVGACWCLLVSVGACWWCLLVLVGACWCCCLCVWSVCSRFLGLSPGPPSARPPFPWTAQNFALSFLSPAGNFFLLSLGVFSLNFGGVFEDQGAQMCTFGLSGCSVKPRRPHPDRAAGASHDNQRNPNAHI